MSKTSKQGNKVRAVLLKRYKMILKIAGLDLILVNEKGFSALKISEQEKKITNPVLQRTLDYK